MKADGPCGTCYVRHVPLEGDERGLEMCKDGGYLSSFFELNYAIS